jgi:pyruvate dehydrogenase E1 component
VGDLIWAAADQRSRGLLFGATAGRTTLGGEGLQHQDGSSLLVASTVPNCVAWDPGFAGELAVILHHAMNRMLVQQQDEFHYVVMGNENHAMPSLQGLGEGVEDDLLRGLYRLQVFGEGPARVRLLGSGAILREVLKAAQQLHAQHGIACEVFSATSYSELAREAQALQRLYRAQPLPERRLSHVQRLLAGEAPIVAASDWVRAWPQLITEYVDAKMVTLGTDGFGRSDTRARLRRHFEVDAQAVVAATLEVLRAA